MISVVPNWQRIFDHELDGKPITRVFATHMHPDHVGQAGWIAERYRIPLFMTLGEYFNARTFASMTPGSFSWTAEQFFQRAGLPEEFIDGMRKHLPRFPSVVEPLPTAYRRLRDGDELRIGDHLWQVVVGYGHSNEHACLHSAELGILISGDQVIPSITSNVSVMPTEPEANPLRYWLESHQRFAELPADTLVLPAHKLPFCGLRERLAELTHHHEERMDLIIETCAIGADRRRRWRDPAGAQMSTTQNLTQRLAIALDSFPEIRLAIVFGSVAREQVDRSSDVDLAVLSDTSLSSALKADIISALARTTGRPVDLIDLQRVGEPLLGEILKHGKRILVRDRAAYAALIRRHLFDAADFLPFRRRILEERRRRWIEA